MRRDSIRFLRAGLVGSTAESSVQRPRSLVEARPQVENLGKLPTSKSSYSTQDSALIRHPSPPPVESEVVRAEWIPFGKQQ
jgi:hypothetical protein